MPKLIEASMPPENLGWNECTNIPDVPKLVKKAVSASFMLPYQKDKTAFQNRVHISKNSAGIDK